MTQVSSLYLHVPFCRHLCNYCDFYKKRFDSPSEQIEEFHQFLRMSLVRHERIMEEYHQHWSPLETLYLGGGTPSLWGGPGAGFFQQELLNRFPLRTDAEFTMEVDPGTWSEASLKAWQDLGLNRISIGTQTLNESFLKVMDRSHSLQESFELLYFCRQGHWNFSLDFLLGLPFSREKRRDIKEELKRFLDYEPKHVSLYILNARSKYPHAQGLPDDEYIREEYLLVSDFLRSAGFVHYEVSNFAQPGFESRHNLKYWRAQAVAALGPTGTGYLPLEEDSAIRYKWKVTQPEVELEQLSSQELNLERTYLTLRTADGWTPSVVTPSMEDLFRRWEAQGYGDYRNRTIRLKPLGFLMLDSLMDDLFRLGAA